MKGSVQYEVAMAVRLNCELRQAQLSGIRNHVSGWNKNESVGATDQQLEELQEDRQAKRVRTVEKKRAAIFIFKKYGNGWSVMKKNDTNHRISSSPDSTTLEIEHAREIKFLHRKLTNIISRTQSLSIDLRLT